MNTEVRAFIVADDQVLPALKDIGEAEGQEKRLVAVGQPRMGDGFEKPRQVGFPRHEGTSASHMPPSGQLSADFFLYLVKLDPDLGVAPGLFQPPLQQFLLPVAQGLERHSYPSSISSFAGRDQCRR